MPVAPEDLQAPIGELEDTLFQGFTPVQVSDRLQSYIDDGTTRSAAVVNVATRDRFVTAWAYYRAYRAQAERLAAQPASASLTGLGSVSVSSSQLQFFNRQSAEWLRVANSYLVIVVPPNGPQTRGNVPVATRFRW